MTTKTVAITKIADAPSTRKASVGRKLNKREAQELTTRIKATANGLWMLVSEAHDRQAWRALGFESWKAYAVTELEMSESRSFQLIDTGRVMKAIGEVVNPEALDIVTVTARETQKVKPHLSTFKTTVRDLVKDGMDAGEAVRVAIQALPTPEKRHRAPKADPNVIEVDAQGKFKFVPAPAQSLLLEPVDLTELVEQTEAGTMTPVVIPSPFSDAALAVVRDATAISELFERARREQGSSAFAEGVFETLRWLTDKSATLRLDGE